MGVPGPILRPEGSEGSGSTANGAARRMGDGGPLDGVRGLPEGGLGPTPEHLRLAEEARQAELAREREWYKKTREELELKAIREAREAYEQGDDSALYRVIPADRMGPTTSFNMGTSLLPRPESHSIYKAKNRTNYNDWLRDCEISFNKVPQAFQRESQKIDWGYGYIVSSLKTVWDTHRSAMSKELGIPYMPTWAAFKEKMLDQLGTLYERQIAANEAIKKASQKANQSPTDLLNELRPHWDELDQTNPVTQVYDFYNALRGDLQKQLDLLPQEKRLNISALEEQANIIWRRSRNAHSGDAHEGNPRKRGRDEEKESRGSEGSGRRKKFRKDASDYKRKGHKGKKGESSKEDIICWNCGSKEHKKPDCKKGTINKGFDFAPPRSENEKGRK